MNAAKLELKLREVITVIFSNQLSSGDNIWNYYTHLFSLVENMALNKYPVSVRVNQDIVLNVQFFIPAISTVTT